MSKPKNEAVEVVARLTIRNLQLMTDVERETLVDWLKDHVRSISKHPSLYGRRFTAQHYGRKI